VNVWYRPTSPYDLGLCRMLWFSALFFHVADIDFSSWAGRSLQIFWEPIFPVRLLGLGFPGEATLNWIQILWKIALISSVLGFRTRLSTFLAAVLGTYLLTLEQNFGKVHHNYPVVILTLWVLAWSRCGDGFSVDAALRKQPFDASPEYRWPLKTIQFLLALIFLSAGISKLRASGLEWVQPDNMRLLLLKHQYYFGGFPWTDWGVTVARYPSFCSVFALSTLTIELGLFVGFLFPSLAKLFVPAAIVMLIAFALFLGPYFPMLIATFVFWVPWKTLTHSLLSRRVRFLAQVRTE
jgi:Vitamin K-dependent gamma-carboxylase